MSVMPSRFVAAEAPELSELGWTPHFFKRDPRAWGSCTSCPLPWRNRIHHPSEVAKFNARAWAEHERARLGERD